MFNTQTTINLLSKLLPHHWFQAPAFKMGKANPPTTQSSTVKTDKRARGEVYLVGAGCGDPELLTLKAHRLLQQTDVVLYDYLVNPEIIAMIPNHVNKIFVGKKCGRHSMSQQEICELMSSHALNGNNVVRLKGGDPSIFGRAAEEIDHLTQHDINFALIPGVTAAAGCAAWSGLPLTHRDCAHSVRFITAHFKNDVIAAEWENFAQSNDTLVFYMGMNKITDIAENLMRYGKVPETPMAIIDQGTTAQHQTHISTLQTIGDDLASIELIGPALIMVGEAITQRAKVKVDMLHPHYDVAEQCL